MCHRLCFLVVFCGLILVAPVLAEGPKISVEKTELHFGEIFQGEKVEYVFPIRNSGNAPLLIERIRSSCGCTAALVSASELAPGAGGEVRAVFDSARFAGEVQKSIYLYSNDPGQPMVQFTLRGAIRQELTLTPPLVDLGEIKAGAARELRLVLANQGDEPIALLGVDVLAPDLSAELAAATILPGDTVDLRLKSVPGDGRKRLNGYLLVKTGSPRVPEVRIPVYGSVVGSVGAMR